MEGKELRRIYKGTEQLILILMAVVLPVFGMIYLYHNSGNLNWDLPVIPAIVEQILMGFGIGLLLVQFLLFRKRINSSFLTEELILKLKAYMNATRERYFLLFLISLISSVGLLFFENAIFIVIFAVTLIFFSVGKPTPDRIGKLLKLDKEQKELIRLASRPD
ncbi:MAG: hypothetical protein P8O16_03445 [Algoriphagus sp.]|uniref:hypothetical protein n=1 Tax=Algoriphagus sp. TaxID=1872435 RepID=UPI00260FF0ED|nr:hypothetical protein [Algoriphagus sp.]MDG1276309.1 hypothetical protein [Algoriphagus sp.]